MSKTGYLVVVAILVVANAVFIGYGLGHDSPAPPSVAVKTPSASPHHAPPPPRLVSAGGTRGYAGPTTLLSNFGTAVVWAATAGCDRPEASFLISVDGGATFGQISSPAAHIIALQVTGPKSATVVGTDAGCVTPSYWSTDDYGRRWHQQSSPGPAWWQTPVGLRAPNGTQTTPCPGLHPAPTSFAGRRATALAVCRIGVFRTDNGGVHWHPAGRLPVGGVADAVAIGGQGRAVLILGRAQGCAGARAYRSSDDGRTWIPGLCLKVARNPMTMSLDRHGMGVLVTAGGTYHTSDYGNRWL